MTPDSARPSSEKNDDARMRREVLRQARRNGDDIDLPPGTVAYFREQLYAAFTGLAIVRVVGSGGHPDGQHAFLALLLGVIGIVFAGMVSEYIAHLLVHRNVPHGGETRMVFRGALGALGTMVVPLALIGAGWLGWMDLHLSLLIAAAVYIVTLAFVAWMAVRRTRLTFPQKTVVMASVVALGFLVVGVQQLAKSV